MKSATIAIVRNTACYWCKNTGPRLSRYP